MKKVTWNRPWAVSLWSGIAIVSAAFAALSPGATAQTAREAFAPAVVPQQMRYEGRLPGRSDETVEVVFRVYAAAQGGEPLWSETQRIAVGEDDAYTVLLGAASPLGLPQSLFAAGQARWLGVSVEQAPETERVLLGSVPYAMKAADAETLGGLSAAGFVTQAQFSAAVAAAAATLTEQAERTALPEASAALAGSGTAGYLASWAGPATLGNSGIYQGGTVAAPKFGLNTAAPGSTLDVNGGATVRGTLNFPPAALATAAAGGSSPIAEWGASSYNSTAKAAQTFSFGWQATPAGNNTTAPYAYLNLMYGANNAGLVRTGLAFNAKGILYWAAGQTFPGTIAGVTVTSPLTGGGTSGTVPVGLNENTLVTDIAPAIATAALPSLQTSFNGVYAQLGTINTFTAGQIIQAPSTVSVDQDSGGALEVLNAGLHSKGLIGLASQSSMSIGVLGALADDNGMSNSFTALNQGDGFTAGVWADGSIGTTNNAGLVATGDDVYAGIFYNDSANHPTISVLNNNSGGSTGLVVKGIATVLRAGGTGGTCGINQAGDISCTGQMKSLVTSRDGVRQMETYTVQSAENWIEDYGSGQLSHGAASIALDPAYMEAANAEVEFHVFLTPGGDCNGLYVDHKTSAGVEVHELGGGTSSIPFDYKIVAKRRGMEEQRLVDVTGEMKRETEAARFKPLEHPLPRTGQVPHSRAATARTTAHP